MCHVAWVMSHMSCVTFHVSHFMCHQIFLKVQPCNHTIAQKFSDIANDLGFGTQKCTSYHCFTFLVILCNFFWVFLPDFVCAKLFDTNFGRAKNWILESLHVTCHMSPIFYKVFRQGSGASRWKVGYQWALSCLVFNIASKNIASKRFNPVQIFFFSLFQVKLLFVM